MRSSAGIDKTLSHMYTLMYFMSCGTHSIVEVSVCVGGLELACGSSRRKMVYLQYALNHQCLPRVAYLHPAGSIALKLP